MLAILSDVHANLEALQAVLADARRCGGSDFISLGDHIGFNGDPAACLDLLIPLLSSAVQGNHEAEFLHPGVFGIELYERMMQRTAALLHPEHRDWIARLPLTCDYQGILLLHAPRQDRRWERITDAAQAAPLFLEYPQHLIFTGHTHRPALFSWENGTTTARPIRYDADGSCPVHLRPTVRYLVNPGSVGQPRDNDPRAAYALLDLPRSTLILRRVTYDTRTASAKIARSGLPYSFGQALQNGTSPTGD